MIRGHRVVPAGACGKWPWEAAWVQQEAVAAKAVWEHDVETDRRRCAEKVAAPPAQAADHEHIAGAVGDDAFALVKLDYAKMGTVAAGVAAWACRTYYKAKADPAGEMCRRVRSCCSRRLCAALASRRVAEPELRGLARAVLASPLSLDELTTTN